jgi:hypothetical protein
MTDLKEKALQSGKSVWCNTWTFAVNSGRRAKILGRYSLACWQQQQIKRAMSRLGGQIFKSLEQGEGNPLTGPEVEEALKQAKGLQEKKEQNYQAIAALKEQIGSSCVVATPDQPGGIEETPEVP